MKTTFQASNGMLSLQIPMQARTKAQKYAISQMVKNNDFDSLISYLQSFSSKNRQFISIDRVKTYGVDELAEKRVNHYGSMFDRMLDTDTLHKPNTKHNDWIGVEIECCVPFASINVKNKNCKYCEGSGEQQDEDGEDNGENCSECDGTGSVFGERTARKK